MNPFRNQVLHKLTSPPSPCITIYSTSLHKLREWLTSCLSGLQASWVAHKLRECLTSCVSGSKLREWLTSCVSGSQAVVYKNITSCLWACVCVSYNPLTGTPPFSSLSGPSVHTADIHMQKSVALNFYRIFITLLPLLAIARARGEEGRGGVGKSARRGE